MSYSDGSLLWRPLSLFVGGLSVGDSQGPGLLQHGFMQGLSLVVSAPRQSFLWSGDCLTSLVPSMYPVTELMATQRPEVCGPKVGGQTSPTFSHFLFPISSFVLSHLISLLWSSVWLHDLDVVALLWIRAAVTWLIIGCILSTSLHCCGYTRQWLCLWSARLGAYRHTQLFVLGL